MRMHMNTTPSSEETQYGTLRWPFTDACTPTSPSHRFRTKKPQQKQKQTGTGPDQDTHQKHLQQIALPLFTARQAHYTQTQRCAAHHRSKGHSKFPFRVTHHPFV